MNIHASDQNVGRTSVRQAPLVKLLSATLLVISAQAVAEPQLTITPATTSISADIVPGTTSIPLDVIQEAPAEIEQAATPEPEPATESPAPPEPEQPSPQEISGFGDFRMMFGTPSEIEVPSWSDNEFDPRPADAKDKENELLLPLPCGGAMVFRRIEVGGAEGVLGELKVELGSPSENDAPMDYRHMEHIAGGFGGEGQRYYYLGKYEVTDLQYRAVMGDCPEERAGRQPATGVSWHDAVAFTQRYTEWLYEKAPERLPEEDGVRGYLRLPTEAEWEYAARGGTKVDAEAFRDTFFPLGEKGVIEEYAWIRESVSSSFEPRPVGSLKPNPYGLYDILGNAAELIFDLFHLNVNGRTHGQAGGFLVKGGHFRSWRRGLSTSWRQEHPHFNHTTGKPNRLDTVGFRIALSVPVITTEKRFKAIRSAWSDRLDEWEPETHQDVDHCKEELAEVNSTLTDTRRELNQCLVASGQKMPPAFPENPGPPPIAASRLPTWEQLSTKAEEMNAIELRRYALGYLDNRDPDTALLLFKQAVRKGDNWSALAVGAFYDPLLFEAGDYAPHHSPFNTPRPELAMCWYQVAQSLGEEGAEGRMSTLGARQVVADPGMEIEQTLSIGRCDIIMEQYGAGR